MKLPRVNKDRKWYDKHKKCTYFTRLLITYTDSVIYCSDTLRF